MAARLARANGRRHDDRATLAESLAGWEQVGARFERACTLLLLPDRAAEGRAELAALGCPPARHLGPAGTGRAVLPDQRICRMVSLLPQLPSAVHTTASSRRPSARHSRSASDRPLPGVQVAAACSASSTLTGSR